MPSIVLLGSSGMLGTYMRSYFKSNVIGVCRSDIECESASYASIKAYADSLQVQLPVYVVNACGTVDPDECDKTNSGFSQMWYDVCVEKSWSYIYISSDAVFSGLGTMYGISDTPDTASVYGLSKLHGEYGHVIRCSIVGEDERKYKGIVEFCKKNHTTTVNGFTNYYWNGITCLTLIHYIEHVMSSTFVEGIVHLSSPDSMSKHELITCVNDTYNLNMCITPLPLETSKNMILKCSVDPESFRVPCIREQIEEMCAYTIPKGDMFDKVLIIGGSGSLGRALIERWKNRVRSFVIFSRSEHKQWEVQRQFPLVHFEMELGDVYDYSALHTVLLRHKPTVIIYAAALKHVDKCESNMIGCLHTNCIGFMQMMSSIENMYNSNIRWNLQGILYVSTDKACEPVNVYGMSKSMGEHSVMNLRTFCNSINVVCVRYGNVVNSNGSIIPLLQAQSADTSVTELTITNDKMTRFFMTLNESVQLIEDALIYGRTGDTWIPELNSMRIVDIVTLFSQKYGKPIRHIGIRAGEKIHEKLISDYECVHTRTHTIEGRRRYVINLHRFAVLQNVYFEHGYSSENNIMNIDALLTAIRKYV